MKKVNKVHKRKTFVSSKITNPDKSVYFIKDCPPMKLFFTYECRRFK